MPITIEEFRKNSPVCKLIKEHNDKLKAELDELERPFLDILMGRSEGNIPSNINNKIMSLHQKTTALGHIVSLIDKSKTLEELDKDLKDIEQDKDTVMFKQMNQPRGTLSSIAHSLNNLFKSITGIDLGFGRAKSAALFTELSAETRRGVASNDDESSPAPK